MSFHGWICFCGVYILYFVYPFICWRTVGFPPFWLLWIMVHWTLASKDLLESLFPVPLSFGSVPRSGLAGSYDNYVFSFLRNCFPQWWNHFTYAFFFFFLGTGLCWVTWEILVPWPGIESGPQQLKWWVLITGLPGNFQFHMNLRINFSISAKKGLWNFDRDCVESVGSLGLYDLLTVLSLSVNTGGVPFVVVELVFFVNEVSSLIGSNEGVFWA